MAGTERRHEPGWPEARLAVANTGSSHRGGEGDHLRENSKYTRLNAKRPRVLISTVHKSQCTERTLSLSRAPHRFQYMYIWTKHKTPYGHARSRRRGTSQRDMRRAICMQGHEAPHARHEKESMHPCMCCGLHYPGRGRGQDGARGKMQQLSVSEPRSTRGRHTAGWRWLRQG